MQRLLSVKYSSHGHSMHYGAKKETFQFAFILRNNMTRAEKKLWLYLRKKSTGYRFRCQHPTSRYVTDFYCHPLKLVIKVDGSIHLLEEIHQNDVDREFNLVSLGLTIIRFTNDMILYDIDNVMTIINDKIFTLKNLELSPDIM